MRPGMGTSVATFPAAGDDRFVTSGLTLGVDALAGTTAVVDEAVGAGRVDVVLVRPGLPGLDAGHPAVAVERDRGTGPGGLRCRAAGRIEGARGCGEGGPGRGVQRCRLRLSHPDPGRGD